VFGKKSLKISKMYSKAVNGRIDNTMTNKTLHHRITDNTMVKRNSAVGQTMVYRTYT
jgi:hypothetical protein